MGHATADANGRTHVRAAMTPNITLRGKVHAVSTLNLRATSAHRGQVSQGGQVRVSFVQGSRRQPRYYIGCFAALLVPLAPERGNPIRTDINDGPGVIQTHWKAHKVQECDNVRYAYANHLLASMSS
ncbi:uncharacterized protein SEPMUDRAFT_115308 [Sphaerulina musiva SO2202]|uniref:Uncharacterized protein n=1 Tax=Sphaerulina musiva (strain SO2202) TaxID=692275 RepID=M3D777_SPHMS|nr:uncharacterized protein SEPMUDRAFT_115308 [Sphaerulina musiva SO2202]EMF14015.1 hypothetical protein SEPMUDRAFT_115308 [Sphaerulina musiva SO2202]